MHAVQFSQRRLSWTRRAALRIFPDSSSGNLVGHGQDHYTRRKHCHRVTRLAYPVRISGSTNGSPSRAGSQDITSPRRSIGPQWSKDAQPLDTSINVIYSKHRDPEKTWSKVIGRKFTVESSTYVNSRCRMNLTRDTILTESPNFVNMGLSSVHISDELGSIFILNTRVRRQTYGSNLILTVHRIGEVTADRVSRTGSEKKYKPKSDFETRRENQDFGHQNNSMSRPPLDLTPLGTNTTNRTTSPIELIPVGTKLPEPTSLTPPTEFSEQIGKGHVPGDPYQDPSSSDSSQKKSNLSKDINPSNSIKNKRDKKKKCQKHKKQNSSGSPSSGYYSSNDRYYRRKRRKKKRHQKTDKIKLYERLTAKLLTTVYKLKIIRFKMDEEPLQRCIYFLKFIESLVMIFPSIKKLVNYFQIIQKWERKILKNLQKRPLGIFCMPILICIAED